MRNAQAAGIFGSPSDGDVSIRCGAERLEQPRGIRLLCVRFVKQLPPPPFRRCVIEIAQMQIAFYCVCVHVARCDLSSLPNFGTPVGSSGCRLNGARCVCTTD